MSTGQCMRAGRGRAPGPRLPRSRRRPRVRRAAPRAQARASRTREQRRAPSRRRAPEPAAAQAAASRSTERQYRAHRLGDDHPPSRGSRPRVSSDHRRRPERSCISRCIAHAEARVAQLQPTGTNRRPRAPARCVADPIRALERALHGSTWPSRTSHARPAVVLRNASGRHRCVVASSALGEASQRGQQGRGQLDDLGGQGQRSLRIPARGGRRAASSYRRSESWASSASCRPSTFERGSCSAARAFAPSFARPRRPAPGSANAASDCVAGRRGRARPRRRAARDRRRV